MPGSESTLPKPERRYAGVTIAQRKAERRVRLIHAAIACFGSQGFHAATLKSLCAQAGLTERYFYESFDNFDALLCCSYEYCAVEILAIVRSALEAAGAAPQARARAALNAYFKAIAADPARARLVLIEIEGTSAQANALYRQRLRMSAEMIRIDMLDGVPADPAKGLSAQVLATGMLGAVYQLAKEWVLSDFKLPRAALVRNCEAIFAGTIGFWLAPAPAGPASTRKVKQ